MIIGICGLARAGKDSFYKFCENLDLGKPSVKHAFADELKKEVDNFLRFNFQISAFTEDPEEKNTIRPLLVAYGMTKRELSHGNYWIEKLEKSIKSYGDDYNHFITDVRFPNEMQKIKDMNGICIYIERENNAPPNSEEEKNDPIIKSKSDYIFKWGNFNKSNEKDLKEKACNFISEVLL